MLLEILETQRENKLRNKETTKKDIYSKYRNVINLFFQLPNSIRWKTIDCKNTTLRLLRGRIPIGECSFVVLYVPRKAHFATQRDATRRDAAVARRSTVDDRRTVDDGRWTTDPLTKATYVTQSGLLRSRTAGYSLPRLRYKGHRHLRASDTLMLLVFHPHIRIYAYMYVRVHGERQSYRYMCVHTYRV